MNYMEDSIDWQDAYALSKWLDENVGQPYKDAPLAQSWARIAKVQEELGEAIAEFISFTAQNPRKTPDPMAFDRMIIELADTALTAIYAMCHFTPSARQFLKNRQHEHVARVQLYGRPPQDIVPEADPE